MIDLLSNQAEATSGFRTWVDAILGGSTPTDYGWVVEGSGVVFSNYRNAPPGVIGDQVMLGVDPEFRSGTVKIVRPIVSGGAKRKVTVIGRDENDRLFLLREGRLTGNSISRLVVDDEFAKFSGLAETPVRVGGERSNRHWYIVADLDAAPSEILAQTVRFANACIQARARAGGGKKRKPTTNYGYGLDEKGSITTMTRTGGTTEVVRLQGYVFEELKKMVGASLKKPSKDAFCVDGMIKPAKLLIEIKTGVSPQNLYEAVGQLHLYPTLIGLPEGLERMLLVPDEPALKPNMSAALQHADISIYTYSISAGRSKPKITFSESLLARCRARPAK